MSKPKLVLSNTTTFFFGGIEATFKKAKTLGFQYVELIPYRWTKPEEVIALSQKYGVKIAGIHLTLWWNQTFWQAITRFRTVLEKLFSFIWTFYLGSTAKNPGLALAKKLPPKNPYLLLHANLIPEMGSIFGEFTKKFHVVLENIPYHRGEPPSFWNPIGIQTEVRNQGLTAGLVFDHAHLLQSRQQLPELNPIEIYRQTAPEVVHISYNSHGIHTLPNKKEQAELVQMLKIHAPRYITIETNPWVSVKKGKRLLENILKQAGLN